MSERHKKNSINIQGYIIGHNFGNVRVKLVIGTVDRMEGTLDEVVIFIGEVWHVHIGVLKPTMEREEGKKSECVKRE